MLLSEPLISGDKLGSSRKGIMMGNELIQKPECFGKSGDSRPS